MKALFVFCVLTAAVCGIQLVAAGIAFLVGHAVIGLGLEEIWSAWLVCGILAAGTAIYVAARLANRESS